MKITNIKLAIGIPLTWDHVPSAFFDSFIAMEKSDFTYLRANNGPIDELRNNLVERAFINGCSHLIMLDADMCYHPKTISVLLSRRLDVVGALCYRRYPPFDPIMYRGEVNHYKTIDNWQEGDLVEVDATGTGCLLFNMNVFRKMPVPWFKFRPNPSQDIGGVVGEDIGFCSDLRKAGFKIFVDTSVPADHLSTMAINGATWKLYKAMKGEQLQFIENDN